MTKTQLQTHDNSHSLDFHVPFCVAAWPPLCQLSDKLYSLGNNIFEKRVTHQSSSDLHDNLLNVDDWQWTWAVKKSMGPGGWWHESCLPFSIFVSWIYYLFFDP
jgi:hypothetical protein